MVIAMGGRGLCGAVLSGGCAAGLCVWSGVHVDLFVVDRASSSACSGIVCPAHFPVMVIDCWLDNNWMAFFVCRQCSCLCLLLRETFPVKAESPF